MNKQTTTKKDTTQISSKSTDTIVSEGNAQVRERSHWRDIDGWFARCYRTTNWYSKNPKKQQPLLAEGWGNGVRIGEPSLFLRSNEMSVFHMHSAHASADINFSHLIVVTLRQKRNRAPAPWTKTLHCTDCVHIVHIVNFNMYQCDSINLFLNIPPDSASIFFFFHIYFSFFANSHLSVCHLHDCSCWFRMSVCLSLSQTHARLSQFFSPPSFHLSVINHNYLFIANAVVLCAAIPTKRVPCSATSRDESLRSLFFPVKFFIWCVCDGDGWISSSVRYDLWRRKKLN